MVAVNFCKIQLEAIKPISGAIPKGPQTIGEHIRKVRLERGLYQKDLARLLGVNQMSVTNWEKSHSTPMLKQLPAIVDFLGYTPTCYKDIPQLASPLFLYRVKHGITQRSLAKKIGIDKTTVLAIEQGKRHMIKSTKHKIEQKIGIKY